MNTPNSTTPVCSTPPTDDKRLDRLLDYTKFHIGVYLTMGGGLVTLIGTAGKENEIQFLKGLIGAPWALAIALLFMAFAGMSGGIIASCCTQYHSFDDLWKKKQGPYKWKWFRGQTWAAFEHFAFWLSLFFLTYAVLRSPCTWQWLSGGKVCVPC